MKVDSIYGPPGCGKTTELLRRMGESKLKFGSSQITFMSFTKAAAEEALTRLGLKGSDTIGTIHSMAFRLGGILNSQVVDSEKLKDFGEKAGYEFSLKNNDTMEQMEIGDTYLSIQSLATNKITDPMDEYYSNGMPGSLKGFENFCLDYNNWKKSNGFIDFNDMLLLYIQNPVNHNTKSIYIDEAQDLSNLQWKFINSMASFPQVAEIQIGLDDDQSIYEWAGANPRGGIDFEEKWEANRTILTQSWRVPKLVHRLAMSVIDRVTDRVPKIYEPRPMADGRVMAMCMSQVATIKPHLDTLILCRSFLTKRDIENQLIENNIPFKSQGGWSPYDSNLARAIRGYHKLKNGEPITDQIYKAMITVAKDPMKAYLKAKEFKPMLDRHFSASFNIPVNKRDWYEQADFTTDSKIRVSTIHSAKGHEAVNVIIHPGMTERTELGLTNNPNQEHRVWYVAITRAKHNLAIISDNQIEYPLCF
jgi:superfamily I DNA/RNA helicase